MAETLQESPYYGYAKKLLPLVGGKTVVGTVQGTSGFILIFSDGSWVASYLQEGRLCWKLGEGDGFKTNSELINSKEYGDGYFPLPVNRPYANEICDIGAEINNAIGKNITGLSYGLNSFNFCFPEGKELETSILEVSGGKSVLRVFWEQW